MEQVAFVFSGQGAQYPGMGKSLCEASPAAKRVFALADSLRPGTSEQCFGGSAEELAQTVNTQPCVFCVDLAAAESLQDAGIRPAAVAGFSLGEVAALTFAGSFSPEQGFELVCKRAAFMQEEAQRYDSAMAAVLKLDPSTVERLCAQFDQAYPVNYNSAAQTVVALLKPNLEPFCKAVREAGGRAVVLAVSGGFHSPFMSGAAKKMLEELQNAGMLTPKLPVYANRTAQPYGGERKEMLAGQIDHPVLWQKSVEAMLSAGITAFVEVGPGKTLCGLIQKIAPGVPVYSVENAEGFMAAKAALL